MKKLIVAICAAAFGLAAQAASVSWSFSWATDADGNDLTSGTAYLMNVATMPVANAQAALTAKTFDATKALATSSITYNDSDGAHGGAVSTADVSGNQTFYVVLVSGGNYGITQTVNTDVKSIGNTVVAFYELSDDSGNSLLPVAWSPGGVAGSSDPMPEPTSGLLLLVGAGILGLRRKRA